MSPQLSDHWIESSLNRLKGRLSVYASGMSPAKAWRDAFSNGVDPELFYNTIARDLPGHTNIHIDSNGGCSKMELTCSYGQTKLINAQNEIHLNGTQQRLHFKEWRIGGDDNTHPNRGHGIGSLLFSNMLNVMKPCNLRHITLKAGREDGLVFWGRRGFFIEEPFIGRFTDRVKENYNALQLHIDPQTRAVIEDALINANPASYLQIARINDKLDQGNLNRLLLRETEPRCNLDIENPLQMSLVKDSLKNLGAIRSQIHDDFPGVEIPAQETGTTQSSNSIQNSFGVHLKH